MSSATQPSPPKWFTSDFLSGGGGALVRGYGKALGEILSQLVPAISAENVK